MSFLRIATLFAAIASFLCFVLDVTNLALRFSGDYHFLNGASSMRLVGIFACPLLFHVALTIFFTALFFRQKG
jgi:hypothetical protein